MGEDLLVGHQFDRLGGEQILAIVGIIRGRRQQAVLQCFLDDDGPMLKEIVLNLPLLDDFLDEYFFVHEEALDGEGSIDKEFPLGELVSGVPGHSKLIMITVRLTSQAFLVSLYTSKSISFSSG
jgi:hypothetical protein